MVQVEMTGKSPIFQGDWFEPPQTDPLSPLATLKSLSEALGTLKLSPETCQASRQQASRFGPNPNSSSKG